jgi:MarR family 2-MHQ and catechol resistance regulon transcriptional repressor
MPTESRRKRTLDLLASPEINSWRTIMECYKEMFSYLSSWLAEEGCSISRFQILMYLYLEGPLAPSELADKLVTTRGNMTMFLRRIKNDQLIESVYPDPNARRAKISLTKHGERFIEDLLPHHINRVEELMRPLSKTSLKTMEEITETIRQRKTEF